MSRLHNILIRFNFFSAPNLEHVLAVANEEGFVRLYDTEAQTTSKLIFKGKCYRECDLHLMWQVRDLLESKKALCKSFKHKCGQYLNPFIYFAELSFQSSRAAAWVCFYNMNCSVLPKASCWQVFWFQCLMFFSILQNTMLQRTELILAFIFLLEWQAHSNAVFDLAWVPGEHRIVSSLLPSNFIFNTLASVCRKWLKLFIFSSEGHCFRRSDSQGVGCESRRASWHMQRSPV